MILSVYPCLTDLSLLAQRLDLGRTHYDEYIDADYGTILRYKIPEPQRSGTVPAKERGYIMICGIMP